MKKEIPKSESKYLKLSSSSIHFIFYYDTCLDSETFGDLRDLLETVYDKICLFFDVKKSLKFKVLVFKDIQSFHDEMEEAEAQDWYFTTFKNDSLYFVNPKNLKNFSYKMAVNKILSRLYCCFITRYGNYPRWFVEGVAKFFVDDQPKFRKLSDIHEFVIHNDVENVLKNNDDNIFNFSSGYSFSQTVIEYILHDYSKEGLKEIFNNKDKSFLSILHVSIKDFCNSWKNFVFSKEYVVPDFLNLEHNTNHFSLFFAESLNVNTKVDIENKLENNFELVCDFFKVSKNFHTNICIYEDKNKFHLDVYGEPRPSWSTGENVGNTINAVDPNNTLPEHDYNDQLTTILHEFVHRVTYLDGEMRPFWLSEGIAIYLSNQSIKSSFLYYLHFFPPKTDILFGNDYGLFQNNGGYIFSSSIIEYIIEFFSIEKLKEILSNSRKNPFDILMKDKESFINDWLKYVYSYKCIIPNFLNLDKSYRHFCFHFDNFIDLETLENINIELENTFLLSNEFLCLEEVCLIHVFIYEDQKSLCFDMYKKNLNKCIDINGNILKFVNINNQSFEGTLETKMFHIKEALIKILTTYDGKMRDFWLTSGLGGYLLDSHFREKVIKNFSNIESFISNFRSKNFLDFKKNNGEIFSSSIVDFILRKHSKEKLTEVIKSPEEGLFSILNVKEDDFFYDLKKYIKNEYVRK